METYTLTKLSYTELGDIVYELFPKALYDEEPDFDSIRKFENITKEGFNYLLKANKPHHIIEFMLFISGDADSCFDLTRTILLYLVWLGMLPEGDYHIKIRC